MSQEKNDRNLDQEKKKHKPLLNEIISDETKSLIGDALKINGDDLKSTISKLSYNQKISLAKDPNTPTYLLERLSRDEKYIRGVVAENPNTPIYVLKYLSRNKHLFIRLGVAQNPKVSLEILETLYYNSIYHNAIKDKNMDIPGTKELLEAILNNPSQALRSESGYEDLISRVRFSLNVLNKNSENKN